MEPKHPQHKAQAKEKSEEYVSERGTDLCIICRADTGIPTDTPVHLRKNYIEGAGQPCENCAESVDKIAR